MKKMTTTIVTLTACLILSMTTFAGTWQQNSTGWWWQNDDGSWPSNQWEWLDGNRDGLAECYYFDSQGYCLQDTVTPDGYEVNSDGAWIQNGAVQYKQTNIFANTINVVTYNNYGGYMDASQNSRYGYSRHGNGFRMEERGIPDGGHNIVDEVADREEENIVPRPTPTISTQNNTVDEADGQKEGNNNCMKAKKTSAAHLTALTPVMKNGMRVVSPCKTSLEEHWGEAIELGNEDYAEYHTAGAYNTFSACIAPEWGISDDAEVSFSIYGDDNLLESISMNYRSMPKKISVDITDYDFVTIKASRTGWSGKVLVGDAEFR